MFALVDSISAAKLELTQHEGRVFWIIVGSINPHTGESRVKGAEIARTIDTTPSNVSRILANLKRRRVIFANGQSCWTVNPWIAFYGSAEDWERITDDYKQPEWNRS